MHPLLARRSHGALYLILWLLVGGLLATLLAGQGKIPWSLASAIALPLAIVFSFVCLSAWYVSRGMPLAGTGAVRVIATAITASMLSSAMWLVIARGWTAVIAPRFGVEPSRGFYGLATLLFGFGVLLYLLSIAVGYLLLTFEASQEAQRRGLQVQVLAREAELRSLRAQIDPHFLFNSLHSISALTAADPAGARRMCLLLAEFLRESLVLGAEERIPLGRELALIDRFLAVERVRFGSRLGADISAGNAADCLVPPLLLQPLVENAVTHGIAHVIEGGIIRVSAERTGGTLRIVAENPCDSDRPRRRGAGVGLANVRARLRALHGTDATLVTTEHNDVWRVELTLPAVEGTVSSFQLPASS
jgi:two-component system, LytTR family, sensor histidine kinase AlgZ